MKQEMEGPRAIDNMVPTKTSAPHKVIELHALEARVKTEA